MDDNDELITRLDSYAAHLLAYVDSENQLSVEAVEIIGRTARAFLAFYR